jgi:hypothetical protein
MRWLPTEEEESVEGRVEVVMFLIRRDVEGRGE